MIANASKTAQTFFSPLLLSWYDKNARVLPWRGIHDPWRTWVSEAMLQQTRVETVLDYYDRFLSRFPTLADLAQAEESEVLKAWQGLGYYSRARNLWKGARQVLSEYGGVLPKDPALLRAVSGIGEYTAGAIASIAYDVPVPAVDGNVIRVLSRVFGIREDVSKPDARRRLTDLAASLVPSDRPGDHNQAIMDLGAGVCVPGTPDCRRCPLASVCDACRAGDASDLPVLPKAKAPRVIAWDVFLLLKPDAVLMRRRSEKLLQGLWCFPMAETRGEAPTPDPSWLFPSAGESGFRKMGTARHVFTHQIWQMTVYALSVPEEAPAPKGYEWIALSALSDLPLPAAMNGPLACLEALLRE